MSARRKYHWTVTLQADTGEIVEQPVTAFWDPGKEGTSEAIGNTAKAEAWQQHNQKVQFHVIAVARDEEKAAA